MAADSSQDYIIRIVKFVARKSYCNSL